MSPAFGLARQRGAMFPKSRGYTSGPWQSVLDTTDPSSAGPTLLKDARNLYPEQTAIGAAWVGRPGFTQLDDTQQLGDSTHHQCQGVHEFVQLDGTRYRILFVGGVMYTYDWTTTLFTAVTLGSATLSATVAHIYAVTFADTVVVTDGVNPPFSWDGTTDTVLSNAPVFYGKPWVYYSKLFAIKSTERSTIVWTEENAPNTGYEAGGYNNAWTIGQTAQDPLTAGIGLNEIMYVFRARSITSIQGSVTTDFSSQGTREGVSETVGTTSPACVVEYERVVYFLDADGRPQRILVGGTVDGAMPMVDGSNQPIWTGARQQISLIPKQYLSTAVGDYDPLTGMVLLSVPSLGDTTPTLSLIYDAKTGVYCGVWAGFPLVGIGVWTDLDGVPRLIHGSADGYPYVHGVPGEESYDDVFHAGSEPIAHRLETTAMGYDPKIEKQWDRCDISVRTITNISGCTAQVTTPEGSGTIVSLSFVGGISTYDTAIWDTSHWSAQSVETHGAVGLNDAGRWATVTLSHEVAGETLGILMLAMEAYTLGSYPAVA